MSHTEQTDDTSTPDHPSGDAAKASTVPPTQSAPWVPLVAVLMVGVGILRVVLALSGKSTATAETYRVELKNPTGTAEAYLTDFPDDPRTAKTLDDLERRLQKLEEGVYLVHGAYKRPSVELQEVAGRAADKLRVKLDEVESALIELAISPIDVVLTNRRNYLLLRVDDYRKMLNQAPEVKQPEGSQPK